MSLEACLLRAGGLGLLSKVLLGIPTRTTAPSPTARTRMGRAISLLRQRLVLLCQPCACRLPEPRFGLSGMGAPLT